MNDKIFTIPIPNITIGSNYYMSILEGISSDVLKNLNIEISTLNINSNKIRLWGIKEHSKSVWVTAEAGDSILFYHQGFIISHCRIINKFVDEKICKAIWNKELKINEIANYILVVSNPIKLKLPYSLLCEYAEYSHRASVRRFYKYSSKGTQTIIDKFRSIDKFISNFII